ncbi:alpha/beta hydrolase [Plantactinospora sonchi]|uniref:Alpha/beta hydrolase n=1 Tax=Plantactinospora sonchi TaxID=1544735 RepID=A0ABU7RUY9_9ACTN
MRPIIRVLGIGVTAAALVASSIGIAGAAPVDRDRGYRANVTWAPCPETADVECGTIPMPVDWADQGGEKFTLALARRKATDPAKREGVLFINLGGPGGSGVDFALVAHRYFSPEVQKRFDIIGIDPRGIARSTPVMCSLRKLDQRPPFPPDNQAEFEDLARFNRELADDCRANTGPLFDHVDTLSVVEDMDALRRSLGERRITYFGLSYSTLIGQQYAERHGDRIRAMVLDSTMDHSLDTWGFAETEAVAAEDSFAEFVAWCDRTESCALHDQDVVKVWHSLLERADRGGLSHPRSSNVITSKEIRERAFSDFYGPTWTPLAEFLSVLNESSTRAASGAADKPQLTAYPFPAVFCLDWSLPVRNHREFVALTSHTNRIAPNMLGSPLGSDAVAACIGRSGDTVNPQHRLRITDAPKILMLNALHDPATAYAWAVNAHRQSRDATVLLTYEGWGHGVYDRSDCTRGTTDAYLISLTVPRVGTRCAAVEPTEAQAKGPAAGQDLPIGPRDRVPGWLDYAPHNGVTSDDHPYDSHR